MIFSSSLPQRAWKKNARAPLEDIRRFPSTAVQLKKNEIVKVRVYLKEMVPSLVYAQQLRYIVVRDDFYSVAFRESHSSKSLICLSYEYIRMKLLKWLIIFQVHSAIFLISYLSMLFNPHASTRSHRHKTILWCLHLVRYLKYLASMFCFYFTNFHLCNYRFLIFNPSAGCGKTILFELAILRYLMSKNADVNATTNAKAVYVAPIKSLCHEKARDWSRRFSHIDVEISELSGDSGPFDIKRVTSADIICTTPEKWDSVTRRWTEHIYLLGKVQLLLIDEIHSIGTDRGATIETVVCRMKTISKSLPVMKYALPAAKLRIVALSATLPNISCIADFINATDANTRAFDDRFRPIPLTVHVIGYANQSSEFWCKYRHRIHAINV